MKLHQALIALICSSLFFVPSFAEDESEPTLEALPITPFEFLKALDDRYAMKKDFSKKYTDDFYWDCSIGEHVPKSSQAHAGAIGRTEDTIHQINAFVFWSRHSAKELNEAARRDFAFVNSLFKDAEVEKWLNENIASKSTLEFKGMTLSLNPYLDKMPEFRTLMICPASKKQEPSRVWKMSDDKVEAVFLKATAEYIFVQGDTGAVYKLKRQERSDEELEWVKANELKE